MNVSLASLLHDRPAEPVNQNRLVALCASVALESCEEEFGAEASGDRVIVTDPVTSAGMRAFIEARGGTHDRYKMGYRNVIDRAAEATPQPGLLAIETSGHSAWRGNAFVDDGCYTAARLLGRLARERRERGQQQQVNVGMLDLLGDSLTEPRESIKVKMPVAGGLGDVPAAEAAVCAALQKVASAEAAWTMEEVNHDGLRCAVSSPALGWLIVRASLHEPIVSIQTESDVAGGTAEICKAMLAAMEGDTAVDSAGLDLAALKEEAAKV